MTREAGQFTIVGGEADRQAIEDVATVLVSRAPGVCKDLGRDCDFAVRVNLYPDQATLDEQGMNPAMRGHRAYSGQRRVEMVTPSVPVSLGGSDLPYSERLAIAVHEFVHLLNDEINSEMPVWLDEGTACFIGSPGVYSYVCRHRFPFQQLPPFARLEQSYGTVPAADLFAYTLVDFVVARSGRDGLGRLLRTPDRLPEVLQLRDLSEFEQLWKEHLHSHCAGE